MPTRLVYINIRLRGERIRHDQGLVELVGLIVFAFLAEYTELTVLNSFNCSISHVIHC